MTQPACGCGHMKLLLGAYVLRALSPIELAKVDRHLAQCEVCQSERAELGEVTFLLSLLPNENAESHPA